MVIGDSEGGECAEFRTSLNQEANPDLMRARDSQDQ